MDLEKLKILAQRKLRIKPKTFYDQLAEEGILREYLLSYFREKYSNDTEFQEEMYEILYKHSKKEVPELEVYLLEQVVESLAYFLEYTKPWRNQKP